MIDNKEADNKILAVPVKDIRAKHIKDKKDLPPHLLEELAHMFTRYKELEGKEVQVVGWDNANKAKEALKRSIQRYKKRFKVK